MSFDLLREIYTAKDGNNNLYSRELLHYKQGRTRTYSEKYTTLGATAARLFEVGLALTLG